MTPEVRSQLDALYMSLLFFSGAAALSMIGLGFTALAALLLATEFRGKK